MGAPVAAGLPTVQRKRTLGVWLTNSPSRLYYDRAEMTRALNELQAAGFTAIYPNVWSRGTTFHRSQFAPVEPALIKAGIELDPICTLAKEARQRRHENHPLVRIRPDGTGRRSRGAKQPRMGARQG